MNTTITEGNSCPNSEIRDENVIRGLIQSLGGELVPATATLRFNLKLADVKTAVPRLAEFGIGCRQLSEHVEQDSGGVHSVVCLEAFCKPDEQLDHIPETDFRF